MREFQANGTTIVLLSHALDMVQEFGQRVLIVDGGQVVAAGTPDEMVRHYTERIIEVDIAEIAAPLGPRSSTVARRSGFR